MADAEHPSKPPPKSIPPPSILGSRTTPTAFFLVLASLIVVIGAILFVALRDPPDLPRQRGAASARPS